MAVVRKCASLTTGLVTWSRLETGMANKQQARSAIDRLRHEVQELHEADSSDPRYQILLKELDRVEMLVNDHWPLSPELSSKLRFGLFGVREFEDKPKLSDELSNLDHLLKTSRA